MISRIRAANPKRCVLARPSTEWLAVPLSSNPAAADHEIVLIKNRRLAGRDRALRGVQFHGGFSVRERSQCRERAGMVVANLCRDLGRLGKRVERNPVAAI